NVQAKERSRRKLPLDGLVMREFAGRSGEKRQKNERDVNKKKKRPASVMDPFAGAQSANRNQQHCPDQNAIEHTNKYSMAWHPGSTGTNRVVETGSNDQSRPGHNRDPEQPKIPCDDETGELVETELRPLVESPFERKDSIQKNDHPCEWEIKKE